MSDNKFLNLYKAGTVTAVISAGAQLWLGFHGNPELVVTGLTNLGLALVPAVAAKRLDGQIKSDVLTPTEPVDALAKAVEELLSKKSAADAALAKGGEIVSAISKGDLEALTRELLS